MTSTVEIGNTGIRYVYPRTETLVVEVDDHGNRTESVIDGVPPSSPPICGLSFSKEGHPCASSNGPESPGQVMDLEQLAAFLGVSGRTVRRLADDGEIPYLQIRSAVRFHVPDVINALRGGRPDHTSRTQHCPSGRPSPIRTRTDAGGGQRISIRGPSPSRKE